VFRPLWPFALPALVTLAGFALRIFDLAGVPLRWDEGWSIAHAALPPGDVLRITAQDVHPPLYYLLLGLWMNGAGLSPFAARMFSVAASATAVPLCFAAGAAWGGRRAGLLAALAFAWLPLAVYYGAVTRMYALAPSFIALAIWGARRIDRRTGALALAVGAAGAMYTLYHSVWALAVLGVIVKSDSDSDSDSRKSRNHYPLSLSLLLSLAAYLPWLLYGVPKLFGRAVAESATNTNQQYGVGYFLSLGIRDLLMTQPAGDTALAAFGALFVAGLVAAARARRPLAPFALATAMIACTLLGVSIAARQWAFNARMLIGAAPALALLIGVSLDALARSRPGRAIAAALLVALAALYFPTSTRFVYEKSLEVFDPYSTTTYRENIVPHAQPGDAVIFNVLSPAGFYASQRAPHDPTWTYALTWDPVREPPADWQARIRTAAQTHDRLWLVLYRGLAQNSNNGDLRGWLDSNFYPARSQWGDEEVFYGLYGVADDAALQPGPAAQWPGITLERSAASAQVRPGGVAAIKLTWRVTAPVARNYKVFVHVMKPDGFVVGQHDAAPLHDLRPFPSLPVAVAVEDRHGVALPADAAGPLRIVVGLYDPDTGERLRTLDGRDAVEISHSLTLRAKSVRSDSGQRMGMPVSSRAHTHSALARAS
jgi:4-amino-4-deoxy-L-arabinose transferase-like glycosyltransferase